MTIRSGNVSAMSTSDRLLLVIHVGFVIFSLGPLTAATSATPRYIRQGNVAVLRYLNRATRLYGLLTLGILLFGLFLAKGDFGVWLTVSITLYVVALVLLLIVERDQRKAVHKLDPSGATAVPATRTESRSEPDPKAASSDSDKEDAKEREEKADEPVAGKAVKPAPAVTVAPSTDVAEVERGRIASLSGVIALIWVVILVLMVWNG
jgi:Ca2+/Na+ antiporter